MGSGGGVWEEEWGGGLLLPLTNSTLFFVAFACVFDLFLLCFCFFFVFFLFFLFFQVWGEEESVPPQTSNWVTIPAKMITDVSR